MTSLIEAGLISRDEGYIGSIKVFETKEEFLSAIILHNIFFYDGKFNDLFISDYLFEEEIKKYDINGELNIIKSGFIRSCICQGWEDYDTDGPRQHFEECLSSKGGGSKSWIYNYYDY